MSKSFPEWWKHGQKVRTANDGVLTLNIAEDSEYWLTNNAGKEVSVFSMDILGPASVPEACRMTTDITELAQSLKAAAEKATQGNWRAFKYHDGRCGIGGGHHDEIMVCEHISKRRPHDAEFIALANPANVLALVEALEKVQSRDVTQAAKDYHFDQQADRIAELDAELEREREKTRRVMSRIAELESRTVKLPQRLQPGADGYDDWYVHSDDDGEYLKVDDVLAMLTAAGIKVEAE